MKKWIILWLTWLAVLPGQAQKGLNADALFQGKMIPQERMVETKVRGKMIAKYQLTFFHSLRFEASADETRQVRELIEKDRGETFKSVETKLSSTLILQLPSQGGKNRFLCFKSVGKGKKQRVSVIYMEGSLSSLEKMEEILK